MRDNRGFTLIELLVVVAIIGTLAAVGVVAYNGYTSSAKINATKSNHKTIAKMIAAKAVQCSMGEDVEYINTSGNTQDANTTPIRKEDADNAFDAATCIGCGACVATCKNASAMLYVSAKVSQFSYLPQGKVEAKERVLNMVKQMDDEGFGNCTNTGACEVECPKGISIKNIARMNREFYKAKI